MSTGGYTPYPEQYGHADETLFRILESLNQARGTAYDTSPGSPVWVENMAIARAIWGAWSANKRAANQTDPLRLTDMLPTWEAIFGLVPSPNDTPVMRRTAVGYCFARLNTRNSWIQTVNDVLTQQIGNVFVGLEYRDVTNDVVWWPLAPNADPVAVPWYATIAHIVIKTFVPAGYTDGDYYEVIKRIRPFLDAMLPAWVTWDWYRVDSFAGVKGFYLDAEHNLDNDVFDV